MFYIILSVTTLFTFYFVFGLILYCFGGQEIKINLLKCKKDQCFGGLAGFNLTASTQLYFF